MTHLESKLLAALQLMMAGNVESPKEPGNWWERQAPSQAALRAAKDALAAASAPVPPVAGQHTPGPWSVWTYGAEDARNVAVGPVAGGLAVADVVQCNAHGIHTADTEATGRANAALISAAPELLAALQGLLLERYALEEPQQFDAQGNWTSNSLGSIAARAAIAKARP